MFAVGDSHIETNPMYGRGCASAFVQSEALSDVLSATPDPAERSRRYYSTTRRLLLPHFNFCLSADRMLQSRSKQSRGLPIPAADQLVRHAFEVAWVPAMNKSPVIAREMVKAMEMREISSLGVRLAVLFYVAWEFFLSFFRRTKPLRSSRRRRRPSSWRSSPRPRRARWLPTRARSRTRTSWADLLGRTPKPTERDSTARQKV
jgi:hypothetical protein